MHPHYLGIFVKREGSILHDKKYQEKTGKGL